MVLRTICRLCISILVAASVALLRALGARLPRGRHFTHAPALLRLLRTGLRLRPNLRLRARLLRRDGFGRAGASLVADLRLR